MLTDVDEEKLESKLTSRNASFRFLPLRWSCISSGQFRLPCYRLRLVHQWWMSNRLRYRFSWRSVWQWLEKVLVVHLDAAYSTAQKITLADASVTDFSVTISWTISQIAPPGFRGIRGGGGGSDFPLPLWVGDVRENFAPLLGKKEKSVRGVIYFSESPWERGGGGGEAVRHLISRLHIDSTASVSWYIRACVPFIKDRLLSLYISSPLTFQAIMQIPIGGDVDCIRIVQFTKCIFELAFLKLLCHVVFNIFNHFLYWNYIRKNKWNNIHICIAYTYIQTT